MERLQNQEDIELELETTKWYVVDSLIMSVQTRQLDRDKAIELLETWFGPDQRAIASIYKHTHISKESS